MSYSNPNITYLPPTAVGIDAAINDLALSLSSIAWIDKSFGRAFKHSEKNLQGDIIEVPKCYLKKGEYINVLPNDHLKAQSFIALDGAEEYDTFERNANGFKSANINVIVWGNLKKIDKTKDYIFTQELIKDVEAVLSTHPTIQTINSIYSEDAAEVFRGYSLKDVESQYLMYPFTGFRINCKIVYEVPC